MGTWHADGLEEAAYIALENRPSTGTALAAAWKAIHDESAPGGCFVPIIGQLDPRASWSIGQVFAVALAIDGIYSGRILMRQLHVGEGPHADRMRDENATALASLPEPWEADVDRQQYAGDCDGWLRWTEPRAFLQAETEAHPSGAWCAIAPESVPLEIGSTNASRSWVHLQQFSGLARWPYGEDQVTVLVMPDDEPTQTWDIPEGKSAFEALLDLHASGVRLAQVEEVPAQAREPRGAEGVRSC